MKLSENFDLAEFTHTQHREIDNTPPSHVIPNLKALADYLEDVRDLLVSCPIVVTSGYRCPALNAAVGGSKTSAHIDGRAVDFIAPRFGSPYEICKRISQSAIDFDQLIFERTWVHFGISRHDQKPRREVLTLIGPGAYAKGLIKPG